MKLPDDHRITFNDSRKYGLCVKGSVAWAKSRGLDHRDMIRNGIRVGDLRALNDGYGNLLLEGMEADK